MPHSRARKTSWFFGSEHPGGARRSGDAPAPVELSDVSLKFASYHDKQYTLKRAALDFVLRRANPPARSEFIALDSIHLKFTKGERVALIGGNGAGKSTLLRVLARIYPPTSGTIRVRGAVAPLIEMGAGFNPELSGRENILLNGAMLGFSRNHMLEKTQGILEFTELAEFADMPLKYYSSGMYMRLAFAIATEVDPEILLIDESLGVGDAAFTDKAKSRILGVIDKSHVVVIVSHDMNTLRELCNRGVWLERGKVVMDAPFEETAAAYLERRTRIRPRRADSLPNASQGKEPQRMSDSNTVIRRADVIVPVYRDTAMTIRCLKSVLEKSGEVLNRLVVVNDCSPEPDLPAALEALARSDGRVVVLKTPLNRGFIAACNLGLAERTGDAALLNSDTVVTEGWLDELAEVAHLCDRTASASPLSNNATICSVPEFCAETKAKDIDWDLVREACLSLPRSTVIPTAIGFCMYMRSHALDVVGLLDPIYAPGYNEENDWCMRAQIMGFLARRANRAFVYHLGSVSFGSRDREALDRRNSRTLKERHPLYYDQVRSFCSNLEGPLAAKAVRAKARGKLSVALDLRHLPPDPVGTHAYASNLVRELDRTGEVELGLIVRTKTQARGLPGEPILEPSFRDDAFDLLHKPAQVFHSGDSPLLAKSRLPLVISHLDLIAHRAQGLFATLSDAEAYRTLSGFLLEAAQAVIAISEHAKSEIIAEFGVSRDDVVTTLLGVDPSRFHPKARETAPAHPRPYWLSVATDFPHKNLAGLLAAYSLARASWRGADAPDLVLIGSATTIKSGLYRGLNATHNPGVVFAGTVSDERIAGLYQDAIALVFPSVYEGFGLPILEAMACGAPVIALPLTSIPEVGGDSLVLPDSGSHVDLAAAMIRIATDLALRRESHARELYAQACSHGSGPLSERSRRTRRRCSLQVSVRSAGAADSRLTLPRSSDRNVACRRRTS